MGVSIPFDVVQRVCTTSCLSSCCWFCISTQSAAAFPVPLMLLLLQCCCSCLLLQVNEVLDWKDGHSIQLLFLLLSMN